MVKSPMGLCENSERITEGFYDTALNEASESELIEIVPMQSCAAKHGRCAEGPCVKTMLGGRRTIAILVSTPS